MVTLELLRELIAWMRQTFATKAELQQVEQQIDEIKEQE